MDTIYSHVFLTQQQLGPNQVSVITGDGLDGDGNGQAVLFEVH